ncbi:hypothetical protein [Legionella longbeachae]|nr:hypothetical protein [Legionella longbeachae]
MGRVNAPYNVRRFFYQYSYKYSLYVDDLEILNPEQDYAQARLGYIRA